MSRPVIALLGLVAVCACSSSDDEAEFQLPPGFVLAGGTESSGGSPSSGGSTSSGGVPGPAASGGNSPVQISGGNAGTGATGGIDSCQSVSAEAELQPVYLVFAFDVSGSMGQGDFPWHDRTLKWEPVVAATRAFFEDPASEGLSASLTVFPEREEAGRCDQASYEEPDVAMSALPSATFGELLDDIGSETWRGGTPTLPMIRGVFEYVDGERIANPGRYALVMVTDGYPQGCDDQSIQSVVDVVAGQADTVPTYVIGVANPPLDGAPDTVSDLGAIAEAGGTEDAFIVDTGNPQQTTRDFQDVVEEIRGRSLVCNLPIPDPPDGRVFDKQRVEVQYSNDTDQTLFSYDADCLTENAWHYDDAQNPTSVVLCDDTCALVQADPRAKIAVNFACQTVIIIE